MSTRCVVHFLDHESAEAHPNPTEIKDLHRATVYIHSDGYPHGGGMLRRLTRFFHAVEAQTLDTRFDDPPYLAAKYVVHEALGGGMGQARPLDFLGVGVLSGPAHEPVDIEWRYFVRFAPGYAWPLVGHEEVAGLRGPGAPSSSLQDIEWEHLWERST